MEKIECFKIQVLSTDKLGGRENFKILKQILCSKGWALNPLNIAADPFLFVDGDRLFLFYEEKKYFSPGEIKMISTKDLKKWSRPQTVLGESFHLSYPFVFSHDDNVYMIPETSALHAIRLYRAENRQLSRFTYLCDLVNGDEEGSDFADSSVYKKNGIYYLMTTVRKDSRNNLKLYYSSKLEGPYEPHPYSPVVSDDRYGRNAGSLFEYDNRLFRFSQDCLRRYGDNVHLFEVNELNIDRYEEDLLDENIINTNIDFYREGGHQINIVRFGNLYIIATDAKEYHYYFICMYIEKIKRVKKKLDIRLGRKNEN